jgi:hypothetical protein
MNKKTETHHYLETRILGAYETAEVVWKNDTEGTYHRTFDDTFTTNDENRHIVERQMDIEGRTFRVCSVFPKTKHSIPTEKLLTFIDNTLE